MLYIFKFFCIVWVMFVGVGEEFFWVFLGIVFFNTGLDFFFWIFDIGFCFGFGLGLGFGLVIGFFKCFFKLLFL